MHFIYKYHSSSSDKLLKMTLALFLLLSACSSKPEDNSNAEMPSDTISSKVKLDKIDKQTESKDVVDENKSNSSKIVEETFEETKSQQEFDKSLLNGIWGANEEDNAFYRIKGDSVYYLDAPNVGYYVEMRNNSLIYHLDGVKPDFKIIKLTKDSLVMKNFVGDIIRLHNRQNK